MALVWPWGAIDPLNPIRAIGIFSHFFEKPWQELFEGTLLTPPEMPRRYLPELLMRQLPELFLIAALAGVLDALLTAMRRDATPQRRALHLCVALAAVLPIAVTVLTRPAMYNGIRHFLFVLPPLAVAGGLAASLLIERANRYGGVIRAMILAVAIGGMALPVIGIVRLHPYQYVWFNHVTGGVQRARSEFMLDYWGLSLKQAAEALRAHLAARGEMPPAGRKWKVAVCGPHPGAQIALGDAFEPTWAPNGADFALMLGEFYCARLDAPAIARIERANVTLARIHDIRGWTVPALFTIPPVERDNPALPTR